MVVSPERTALLRQKVATHAGGNKAKYLDTVKANKVSKNKKKEEQAKTLAAKKDLLETAQKQHEADPNDDAAKKALDAQNEELRKLETEIQTYDADIMQWEREEEDLDKMDWESLAPDESTPNTSDNGGASSAPDPAATHPGTSAPDPAANPPSTSAPDPAANHPGTSAPGLAVVAPGGTQASPVEIDDGSDDPEDLIVISDFEEKPDGTGKTTVAWGHRGRGEVVINAYGPPNARIHRLEAGSNFDRTRITNFSAQDNRYGEAKPDGYYIRQNHEVKTIQGVAFRGMDKLQSINPGRHSKGGGTRYPETQVLVKWFFDGETKKSWETRSTIRRLWKDRDKADKAIFEAAVRAEKRHEEWKTGERKGRDSSPTPAPPDPPPEAPEIKKETEESTPAVPLVAATPTPAVAPIATTATLTVPTTSTTSTSSSIANIPSMDEFFETMARVKYKISLEELLKDPFKVLQLTADYKQAVQQAQSGA